MYSATQSVAGGCFVPKETNLRVIGDRKQNLLIIDRSVKVTC